MAAATRQASCATTMTTAARGAGGGVWKQALSVQKSGTEPVAAYVRNFGFTSFRTVIRIISSNLIYSTIYSTNLPLDHPASVGVFFSHETSSSRRTCVPLSDPSVFTLTFCPSTNCHFCSFTLTNPASSSSGAIMMANGTSSFSLAANCA